MKLAPCNEDYAGLAELVRQSWSENPESSLDYTPEFLRTAFQYPGTDLALTPVIQEKGQPVAFIAGFPRTVEWNGSRQRLILSTLLTSSPETKGKGYGAWLWTDLVRRVKTAGYDGMISICVEGGPVNRIVEECGRRLRYPTGRIFTVRYRSVVIPSGGWESQGVSDGSAGTDADVDLFLELAEAGTRDLPLRRVWTREEAEWQCRVRTGAIHAVSRGEGGRGMITGYVADMLSADPVRVVSIEDLLWHELAPDGRVRLLREFLAKAASAGARIASAPITGQTEYDPLKELGFRGIGRRMNMYVTRWEDPPPEPVNAMYLDVF